MRPWGLRTRLVAITLVLLAVGLSVAGGVAYFSLRAHLYERIDGNLRLAANQLERLSAREDGGTDGLNALMTLAPPRVLVTFLDDSGEVIVTSTSSRSARGLAVADLSGVPEGIPTDLHVERYDSDYRVLLIDLDEDATASVPDATETLVPVDAVVIGLPTDDARDTLQRLLVTETVTAVFIMVSGLLVARWALGIGLVPLRGVARSARAIADGDHQQRVPAAPEGTELGEVTSALNAAFDARTASESALRAFVADASHELRTPLASVHGWADLYAQGALRDQSDVDDAMANIRTQAARMQEIVEGLLALARIDAGSDDADVEIVDLGGVITGLARDFSRRHPEHRLVLDVADETVVVAGRLELVRQAAGNLVGNAFRHTPAGTTVRVSVTSDGTWAALVVEDDGPGLGAEERARAFERFWRADPRGSGGSGLGLAIARAAAEGLGGTAELEQVTDGGLRAVVRLPVARPVEDGVTELGRP